MERSKSMRVAGSPKKICNRPSPYDFTEFLPWACKQYEIEITIQSIINEGKQFSTRKAKLKSSISVTTRDKISSSSSLNFIENFIHDDSSIKVMAIFDPNTNNLRSIKIENNEKVPRTIFQVIALIVAFYPSLTSLSAGKGLDAYCIHEITRILPKSSITEVCLDGSYLKHPNYYIILETVSNLNCLSLARCQINDEMTKKIAENLTLPRPGAKTLTFLNLSSNSITDTGAAHLADALKTNRHLAYLNLADNRITDTGASHIFNIMLDFPILSEDLKQSKIRLREYMDEKNKLFHKFVAELKSTEETKSKLPVGRGKIKKIEDCPLDKVASLKLLTEVKVMTNLDMKFFDKAEKLALQAIGPFEDPFANSFVKDEISFCTGNNTLSCLNLAFNNLSYSSLQKLIKVLNYQKHNQQTPRGLFRVRLEGNYLPSTCEEYTEISMLLDLALEATRSREIKGPKKNVMKKTGNKNTFDF